MRVGAVITDLMLYSRIESAASAAGALLVRVDTPYGLPLSAEIDLLLVDWSSRCPDWADAIAAWRGEAANRVIAFGRHTDLEAHAAARSAGIGPMWARSKLVANLRSLFQADSPVAAPKSGRDERGA